MTIRSVAVIVPTLNEAKALEQNLPALLSAIGATEEVVVSDGGSRDRTTEIAENLGARVVSGATGRGPQLNLGARATRADALVFLHADTVLPAGAFAAIGNALDNGSIGGGFKVRFDSDRPIYRLGSAIVNLRTRLSRAPLGDQAQFASRSAFDALGGFPDWPILEDLEFMRRLKSRGPVAVLEPPVATSARRFDERGITRTIVGNWLIFALYFAGASPERLARLYRNVR